MATSVATLLNRSPEPLDACGTFVLLWIAHNSDAKKGGPLPTYLASVNVDDELVDGLRQRVVAGEFDDFFEVCSRLSRGLDTSAREFLLEWSIRVAAAAGQVSTSANFILRFLADLFDLNLPQYYRRVAGEDLPPPGDPSSVEWWAVERERHHGRKQRRRADPAWPMTRAEACAVLGVRHDAGPEEIKLAYRRLVNRYHPDKHRGEVEDKEREQAFLAARRAYEVLRP